MLFSSLPILLATALSLASLTSAIPTTRSTACNNSPDLCNKAYNEITYLGAHDAAFIRDSSTDFSVSGNQFYNATVALSAGIRLLQAQVHNFNGILELCHTSCSLFDAGSLQTFLSSIKTWMDANPNDVVTLLLVNSDSNSTATFGSVFSASGIDIYGYTPSASGPQSTWPTLQSMIASNSRLVTFLTNTSPSNTYPYLLPEFSYVFETPFTVNSLLNFTCALDRPSSLTSASSALSAGYLSLQNHFVDTTPGAFGISVPDVTDIATTNSPVLNVTGSLGTEVTKCASQYGKYPNFVLVDFWNVAGGIAAVDQVNGITPTGRQVVSQGVLTTAVNGVGRVASGLGRWTVAGAVLVAVAGMNVFWL